MWIIYIGVTNLGCLFIEPWKCSAHKAGRKVLPPPEKHVVSWLFTTSGKFGEFSPVTEFMQSTAISFYNCSADSLWSVIRLWSSHDWKKRITVLLLFSRSPMTGNVAASRCSCMPLCSQGPHLWPFISSQVKGLRDDEAHRQTRQVWDGQMFIQPRPQVETRLTRLNVLEF